MKQDKRNKNKKRQTTTIREGPYLSCGGVTQTDRQESSDSGLRSSEEEHPLSSAFIILCGDRPPPPE